MTDKLALYFGCYGNLGHFLHEPLGRRHTEPENYEAFGWDYGLLDTGLLKNRQVPDVPDGRVHWTFGGSREGGHYWHAFVWWDRSVDRRGACNSGFYVRGFGPPAEAKANARAAFEYACAQWPAVVERQLHPLVLVNLKGEPEP